ncbi:MAG: O-antigen ligase family protein [Gemmatimonadaceae bacterium]
MSLLIATLLVPVIAPSGFFFPYVAPRNLFFRALTELGVLALLWTLCFGSDELDLRYEPIFWALVAFIAAAFLSAVFSPATRHSLFGDFERMGGVLAWVHLALFFLLLRAMGDEEWSWLLNAALLVGLFISVNAIVEHEQLARLSQTAGRAADAASATIGNAGLLAAYLLFAIGIACYLASTSFRFRLLYVAAAGIDLLALVYAENRSSVIGLALGVVVGAIIFSTISGRLRRRWMVPALAVVAAAAIFGISTAIRTFPNGTLALNTPVVLRRLASTSPVGRDESRTMQWRAAIEGFKDRPIVGYGPENHNLVWSAHFDPGIYAIATDVFDRTHNQYLEVLATTGLLGAVTFLGIWLAIGVTLARAYVDDRLSASSLAILCGLQVAYASYLLFWFVDINATMLWILVAALIASRENPHGVVRPIAERHPQLERAGLGLALMATLLIGVALYKGEYLPARVNLALAKVDGSRGSVGDALGEFPILAGTGVPQTAHTPMVMAEYLGSLHARFAAMRGNPRERRMLEIGFASTRQSFREEIHRDTLNDRLYTAQAGLLLDEADFYGSTDDIDHAISTLERAIDLSPHRIQPRLLLAKLYADDHEYARARSVLEAAVKADPDLGEPRYRLAEQYLRAGKSDSSQAMLESSLRHGYVGKPDIYLAIGKRLEFSGRGGEAARLYTSYLESKYTKAIWDGPGTVDKVIPSADIAVAAHLPLLYVRSQESELAIKSAAALSAFDSSQAAVVERFVTDVGSRRRNRWVARNSLLQCGSVGLSRKGEPATVDACSVFGRRRL